MEPLNEKELDELLKDWKAPLAPATLEGKLFSSMKRAPRAAWLLTGTISIPVPLFLALILLLCVLGFGILNRSPAHKTHGQPTLGDFRPVKQLQPRIIRGSYEAY